MGYDGWFLAEPGTGPSDRMTESPTREQNAIALAEKLFGILDQGRFTATYKYAVLLALIDLCLEKTTAQGLAPETITTRQLAEKVIELYWHQVLPYAQGARATVLLQNLGGRQAEIVARIAEFRSAFPDDPLLTLERARTRRLEEFQALVDEAEWKLIEMPLPRLQVVGNAESRFLYDISWDSRIAAAEVRAYQRGRSSSFDNRILLKPGVGEQLVQLNSLLRPLLYRQWADQVARMNRLEEYQLEEFLFGPMRIATDPVRAPLMELQGGRCFYCKKAIDKSGEVDHFIPWSRYPDDNLANLVAAHTTCNNKKRDFLAATEHVERWSGRLSPEGSQWAQLQEIATSVAWPWRPDTSVSVGRGIYLRLPADARLWRERDEFEEPDRERLARALAVA